MISVGSNSLANHKKWLPILPRISILYSCSRFIISRKCLLIPVKIELRDAKFYTDPRLPHTSGNHFSL